MVASQRVLRILILTMTAVFALLVIPAARADSFTFSVSGSTEIYFTSPNDNYWGYYTTGFDQTGTTTELEVEAPFVSETLDLANQSFFLPAGSTITSASIELVLPTTTLNGTSVASNVTSEHLPPPNPSDPTQIAPTFVDPGTATLTSFYQVNGISVGSGLVDLTDELPIISGNQISTGALSLNLVGASGFMEETVATQGFNYSGYVTATGQVSLPYTLEVVGTYTPAATPEPSAVVLLGTGMLALMAGAWWRRNAIS